MTLVALIVVLFLLYSNASMTSAKDREYKRKAIEEGKPIYTDYYGKRRSVENDELCTSRKIYEKDWKGAAREEVYGSKTGRIYQVFNYREQVEQEVAERFQKSNEKLKADGKMYRYKKIPKWNKYVEVDVKTGRPIAKIKIERIDGKRREVLYYADETHFMPYNYVIKHLPNNKIEFEHRVLEPGEEMLYR